MEVHPILGRGDIPSPGFWYVISSRGQYPSMRVGHSISYVSGRNGAPDKLVIIGGANPSGPFAETHILYLDKYEWDELECDGLTGRYEHCAFVADSQPDNIYIFGGANQTNNLNDVQMLNLTTEKWSTISVSGTPPSPRTCRNSTSIGNKLYVFAGGGERSEPVNDRSLHVFDAESLTWGQPELKGKVPNPRLGHVMVAVGTKIYLHGGMARDIFYNELHELDTETMTWKPVRCAGDIPPGCTAHAAVAISNTQFCIQGGMTPEGALDTTYVFDTVSSRWQKVMLQSPAPACRLDHAACLAYLTGPSRDRTKSSKTEGTLQSENKENATQVGNDTERKAHSSAESSGEKERTTYDLEPQADLQETPKTRSNVHPVTNCETDLNASVHLGKQAQLGSECTSEPSKIEQRHISGEDLQNASKEQIRTSDGTDEIAEALASALTLEGDRQVPAQTSTNPNSKRTVDALSSLLSGEGAKQVLPGGQEGCCERTDVKDDCTGAVRSLVCVIHGGMDTGGEIFDDCLLLKVDVSL